MGDRERRKMGRMSEADRWREEEQEKVRLEKRGSVKMHGHTGGR